MVSSVYKTSTNVLYIRMQLHMRHADALWRAELFCMKWPDGCHLKSTMLYLKSDSVNWRTILPYFIPVWFEMMELWAFWRCLPQQQHRDEYWYEISIWSKNSVTVVFLITLLACWQHAVSKSRPLPLSQEGCSLKRLHTQCTWPSMAA